MKTIKEKIEYYKESLDLFDDGMEKYKFLIDQAKNAVNFPEEFRNDSFKHIFSQNGVPILLTSFCSV